MSAAAGVPPWARPVLEELRGFADAAWRGLASQDRVTAAWAGAMRDAITAALASDAGAPEPPPRGLRAMTEEEMAACEAVAAPQGEPFFHKLGCPKINGRGTAAHCTCPPDRERPEQTPAAESTTNAPETSTSLVGTAPDAELDGLILAHASTVHQHPQDFFALGKTHQAIRAHVERVKREAFTAGHKAGARVMAAVHEAPAPTGEVIGTAELYDSYVGHLQETHPYPRDAMIPVDLVRREKAVKVNRMVPDQTSERRVVLDIPMEVAVSLRDLTHCVRDDPDRTYRGDIEEVASALEVADVPYSSYWAKRFRGNVTAKLRPIG